MIKVPVEEEGLLCAVKLHDFVHNSCHIIPVCVFSSSPESIILSLPSCCQPFHLCHTHSDISVCFFIASFLCVNPLLTSGSLVLYAVSSGHLNTSTYLLTLVYLFFFSYFCIKSCCCCYCSHCNLILPPPQICQVRLNLTSQVAFTDKEHRCASE